MRSGGASLRLGPGLAAHRSAALHAAPHPGHAAEWRDALRRIRGTQRRAARCAAPHPGQTAEGEAMPRDAAHPAGFGGGFTDPSPVIPVARKRRSSIFQSAYFAAGSTR